MGFEPVSCAMTGAMLYQLSYEATHWSEVNELTSYLPVRSEMM